MFTKTHLKDYQSPPYTITKTYLDFHINDSHIRVNSTLTIQKLDTLSTNLRLNGHQELSLESISLDSQPLSTAEYENHNDHLIIPIPSHLSTFTLNTTSIIYPENNVNLMGLYKSDGILCSQCEPEGFRSITWYLDRPDVLAVFTVKITASSEQYPVILSNGNLVHTETVNQLTTVIWEDPLPKPAYLFALVAGQLSKNSQHFITQSGQNILLELYASEEQLSKITFAMEAIKKAINWDETTYQRFYDLERFMIVAIDNFNFGAMENKGLNIFNTTCLLASLETSEDRTFLSIENIIAHEYFHNWSGNRVTCRDWFQLSLKEGLTVFRDCEFSSETTLPLHQRIETVSLLRNYQYAEDNSPNAHPVQPQSYLQINNFYTTTIYDKGAELIRMYLILLGRDNTTTIVG